jgi:hypothetical protein
MAGKKDFSSVNTGRVYGTIAEATAEPEQQEMQEAQEEQRTRKPRKTYTEQEQQEFMAAGATKGRKGCKAIRINMAFTPDVHDYIKTMARVRGESITDFTNYIFGRSMEENREIYERAKAFKESF